MSVSQSGGVLGGTRRTELVDGTARALDEGEVTAERQLDAPVRQRLAELVERCSAAEVGSDQVRSEDPPGPDSMATTVEFEVDGRRSSISYSSGEDVPREVAELVSALLETPYRDPGTRWKRKS